MRSYGKDYPKHAIPDCHPPKGSINWWEDEFGYSIKKRERRQTKRTVKQESEECREEAEL